MENNTRRAFKSRMDAKQDVWRAIPALMGDGNGTVAVPNQENMVYIRVGDGDLGQAFNNRCQLRDNLAIYVGYDPVTDPDRRIFQVLSVRMADYAGAGNVTVPNVGPHHTTHEFGGGDDVFIDWRRLMGLRVGRPAVFVVTVDPGYIYRAGWIAIPSTTVDLTVTHAALVGTQAQYVLISLSSVGVVTTTAGAVVLSPVALAIADVPTPPAGHIPLAAVRLYKVQTEIGDTPAAPDIIDLRFPTYNTASAYVTPHDILSASHGDSLAGAVVDGDTIIGNVTPKWSRLAISIPAANVRNVFGVDNGELRPSWKTALDATAPTTIAESAVAAAGTSLIFSHRDHTHGAPATWAATAHDIFSAIHGDTTGAASPVDGDIIIANVTPKWSKLAISIPAANVRNALGIDNGELRPSWKTTLDATNPTTIGIADAGGPGTSLIYSHRDHQHPSPATWTATAHDLLSAIHGDTLASAVTRGSLIYGNATPKWAELDLGGAAGSFLTRDATDVVWSGFYLAGSVAHTYTFPDYDISWPAADAHGYLHSDGAGTLTWDAGGAGGAHDILSATHTDTLADSVVDGDVIIGNVTPKWSRLAISVPAANVRNVLGIDNGELRPSWKTALDATAPTTIAESAAAAAGTSLVFSHRDHTHGAPATWAATAHAIDGATHTVAGRTIGQILIATGAAAFGWTDGTFTLGGASTDIRFPNATVIFSATPLSTCQLTLSAGITVLTGPGTLDLDGNSLHVTGDGDAVLGTGTATRLAVWSTANTIAAGTIVQPAANVLTVTNSAASTLALAITSAKTLTLTATDDFNLTIPKTGTAVVGTGTATRLAVWSDANTLAAGTVVQPATNVLTLLNSAASTLSLAITSAKTLTLTAVDDYNLTIPATGVAALLATVNVFTNDNTIASGKFLTALTDGSTGGLRAGSGSDVLWYRSAADMWRTPDGLTVDAGLNIGTASSAVTGQVRASGGLLPGGATAHGYNTQKISSLADHGKAQLGLDAGEWAFVFVMNSGTGAIAIYNLNGGAHATYEVSDPANYFTVTEDNDNTTNIYWDAGNARYELNNELGSAQDYYIFLLRYGNA